MPDTVIVLPLILPVTTAPVAPLIPKAALMMDAAEENDMAADRLMLAAVLTDPSIVTLSEPVSPCSVVRLMLETGPPRSQALTADVLYCQNRMLPGLTFELSKPRK